MIEVKYNGRLFEFEAALIREDDRNEYWNVTGNDTISLRTNRPLYLSNPGLRKRKPKWFLLSSPKPIFPELIERIGEAIILATPK